MNDQKIPDILPVRLWTEFSSLNPAKPESRIVQTDEYTDIPFRILSKTFIPTHNLDLSRTDALKNAADLFRTRIIKDHRVSVDSVIGSVVQTEFSEGDGSRPAGVDGTYRFHRKIAGDIIDKILADPPLLNATSAAIEFRWEPSHKMDSFDFWLHLGDVVDGETVRYIVTEITDVMEVSIVYMGADRYATKLKHRKMQKGIQEFDHYFRTLAKQSEQIKSKGIVNEMDITLNRQQAAVIGIAQTESVRLGLDKNESVKVDQAFFDQLVGKTSLLEKEKADLQKQIGDNEKFIQAGKNHEKEVREDALKNYRSLMSESQDENIIQLLQTADLETVRSLNRDYLKRLESVHPEKDGTRQSSVEGSSEVLPDVEVDEYKVK